MTTEPPDWASGFTPGIKAFPGGGLFKSLPMSPAQIKAFIQFLITAIIAQIAIAFGGIEIAGWQPFEFLVEWGQDLQAQASEAYSQSVSAQATANTANSNATTALGNFASILSGLGLGSIAAWISDLTGTKATATTANSNASTALSTASSASSVAGAVSTSVQNAWNLLVDAFTGGSGATGQTEATAANAAAAVTNTANTANAAALAAQATLAEQETSTPAGGNSSTYTPSGSDGAALTGWTTGPTSGDLCIRVNNGVTAIGVKAGKGTGRVYGVYTAKQYATVDQSASIVLGELPWGSSSEQTTIKIRSTSGLTNGAYCHVESDGVKIGYYSFSGGTWTFNQLAAQAMTIRAGDRVTFRCYGLNYYVLVNGSQVLSFTNVGNNVTQNVATNNYCGLSQTRTSSFVDFDSFRVTSFSMTDYSQGTSVTTSWLLTRSSTATASLTLSNGAAAVLPNSFFATTNYATGVSASLTTGTITIATDGVYKISAAVIAVANASILGNTAAYAASWAVYKGGAQITGPILSGGEVELPLLAGDTIQVGVVAAAAIPTSTRISASSNFGVAVDVANVRGFASFSGVYQRAA